MSRIHWYHVALFFCFAAICRLTAQTPTATLLGTVTDPSGAAVVGAKVEVRNSGTNEVRKAQTDARGEFTMPNLAAGYYDVNIVQDGFRTLNQSGLELQLDQQARMEYRLQLGSLAEKVEVTASVPLVNTDNGAVKGDVMVSQEMVEMPLDGRDFGDLLFLMPSVVPSVAVSGGGFQSAYNTNGQRGDNINFVIDGFNNRNPRDGTPAARPNLDAMQEFKTETSGYSAESGRAAGGLVTMVLKSGTNQLHGGLFEFLRNDLMDARNFFATSKPELRRNQFGGLLNGPVVIPRLFNGRNRTFFLFSWESQRQVQGSPALAVVPTAAVRQGTFSSTIKDPLAAGSAFPGNQIPQARISTASSRIQNYYPLPNNPGLNNFYSAVSAPNEFDSPIVKIDQVITSRDNLSFKYLKRYARATIPYNSGNIYPYDSQTQHGHNTLAGLTYTRTITPTLVNEARFSISRSTEFDTCTVCVANGGSDYNSQFGLPGPSDPNLQGFPLFNLTNYAVLGPANQMPLQYWVTSFDYSDTLTWVKGSHLIKAGIEALHSDFFRVYDTNSRGTYAFTGSWTGQPYADFLLGTPNNDSILLGTVRSYLLQTNYSAFIQDAWKISSRLTLNLGMRYELPEPLHDKYGRLANFVPELNRLVVASFAGAPAGAGFTNASSVETAQQAGLPDSIQYTSYKKFAPRLGVAWRPFGGNRTVVRGGYGIFYGTFEFNDLLNNFAGIFPFVINVTNNRNANNPTFLTFNNPFPVAPSLVQNVVSVNGIQLQTPNPYAQSWNLTMEREIGHGSAVEVGYVGSKGTHLSHQSNINQPFRSASTAPNFPVPYPAWNTINYIGFNTNSIYNAASVTFRRRFTNNFFYRASYTFSKSLDSGSIFLGGANGMGGSALDARNMRLDRGRSDFDRPHVVTLAFSWQSPRNYNLLLRGWQLAGSGIVQAGRPYTLTVNNVNQGLGESVRPNRIAQGTVANPSVDRWYDVSAFPPVPTGAYTFGTSGRNILNGPGSITMNLTLSRNFRIREKHNVQLRWEAFNFLNHANFALPVTTVNTPNAATITSAASGRSMQVALRYSF
jgi:hypothetical protein